MNDQWLSALITKQEAGQLALNLNKLLEKVYLKDVSWQDKVNHCLTEKQQRLLDQAIKTVATAREEVDKESLLNHLIDQIKALPAIELSVARDLPYSSWVQIADWLKNHLGNRLIIDYRIQPDLLGGVIIKHQGVRRDYSLRHRLQTQIDQNKFQKYFQDAN
jgi:F0F1-type ATP synthase delta subunit